MWLALCVFLLVFHVKHDIFIITMTAAALLLSAVIVYLRFYFKKYCITVDKGAIIIKSGVIIRTERVLPTPRLIFAESFTTPFSRFLGLSLLSLRAIKVNLITAELTSAEIKSILGVISDRDEL